MSAKINKDGKEYPVGVIPNGYPARNIKMANGDSVEEAVGFLSYKKKTETLTSNANGNLDLNVAYPDYTVIAVIMPNAGYKCIPYVYQSNWYATLCDSSGTNFDAVPNQYVNATIIYV